MSTYKNTSGDLTLTGNNGSATLTVNYANTIFNGSFTYTGNLTTVDDFIVVAANNTGTVQDMGLLAGVNVGNGTYAGLRFDVASNEWQISSSVYANGAPNSPYVTIASGGGGAFVAGSNTQIQFNQASDFGASPNLTYDYSNNKLTIQGYEVLGNIGSTPTATPNAVAIYNKAQGAGGTGLYVKSSTADDELISLTKARLYSIIF
jgi:hypothetical protein